jgi:hypothetical protein
LTAPKSTARPVGVVRLLECLEDRRRPLTKAIQTLRRHTQLEQALAEQPSVVRVIDHLPERERR